MAKRPTKSSSAPDARTPALATPTAKMRTALRRSQAAATGDGRDRRQVIVEIAKRRFARFGYGATTIREIASDAHLLSGSLYHHFDTKDDILNEIITAPMQNMLANFRNILDLPDNPEAKLVHLIRYCLEEFTRDQDTHMIIFNERRYIRHSDTLKHVTQIRNDQYQVWRHVLFDGMRENAFRTDLNPFLAISNIIRLLYTTAGWFTQDPFTSDEAYSLEEVSAFQLKFILSGIRAPERISQPIPKISSAIFAASV